MPDWSCVWIQIDAVLGGLYHPQFSCIHVGVELLSFIYNGLHPVVFDFGQINRTIQFLLRWFDILFLDLLRVALVPDLNFGGSIPSGQKYVECVTNVFRSSTGQGD